MKEIPTNRRQFISKIIPACAVTCLGTRRLLGSVFPEKKNLLQDVKPKHKFNERMPKPLSYRQVMGVQYSELIQMARALEKDVGKEKMIVFLKKATTERLTNMGKMQASQMGNNSFKSYVNQFRGGYQNQLTKEIVEDTETVFEIKVTECIWADTFLSMNAGDIGYAWVCWGDYAWAEGFNPKIKMVRDKTLMQGHSYCNHRYIWQV